MAITDESCCSCGSFLVSSFSWCSFVSEIGRVCRMLMSNFSSIESPYSGKYARDSISAKTGCLPGQ